MQGNNPLESSGILEGEFDAEKEFASLVHRLTREKKWAEPRHLLKAINYFEARKQYFAASEIAAHAGDITGNNSLYNRAILNLEAMWNGNGALWCANHIHAIKARQFKAAQAHEAKIYQ